VDAKKNGFDVDLQAWRADALACRAVVQGLRN
jgi:hypothetical protein